VKILRDDRRVHLRPVGCHLRADELAGAPRRQQPVARGLLLAVRDAVGERQDAHRVQVGPEDPVHEGARMHQPQRLAAMAR
jgi:hypothetical protein